MQGVMRWHAFGSGTKGGHTILELPQELIRVSSRPNGIELYFPPLRTPMIAAALGLFGVVCIVLPLLAVFSLLAAGGSAAHGLLALVLTSSFVAPFPVFGAVFIALAVYLVANSLTVSISPAVIRSERRIFGISLRRREIKCADIAAIEGRTAAKYQTLFGAGTQFRLIARHVTHSRYDVVVAENLAGETMMEQVHGLIAGHAGLDVRSKD